MHKPGLACWRPGQGLWKKPSFPGVLEVAATVTTGPELVGALAAAAAAAAAGTCFVLAAASSFLDALELGPVGGGRRTGWMAKIRPCADRRPPARRALARCRLAGRRTRDLSEPPLARLFGFQHAASKQMSQLASKQACRRACGRPALHCNDL